MGDDYIVGMQMDTQGEDLLIVTENGIGKRTAMNEFSAQHRGGKGVKCYKLTEKTGNIMGFKAVNDEHEILIISTEGIVIRIACKDISTLGRYASGVKLINLSDDENVRVASITKVKGLALSEDEETGGESEETEDSETTEQ